MRRSWISKETKLDIQTWRGAGLDAPDAPGLRGCPNSRPIGRSAIFVTKERALKRWKRTLIRISYVRNSRSNGNAPAVTKGRIGVKAPQQKWPNYLPKTSRFSSKAFFAANPGLVIVEIDVDALQFPLPCLDLLCPVTEPGFRVVTLIRFFPRTVEPHIGEVCGDLDGRLPSGNFENAKSRVITAEQLINSRDAPTGIAKFESVMIFLGQYSEKFVEPFEVDTPTRR